MSNLAKRKRYSAAKAAIEASLQIVLEQAQAIYSFPIDRYPVMTTTEALESAQTAAMKASAK
jgi:hypothetical protein